MGVLGLGVLGLRRLLRLNNRLNHSRARVSGGKVR
jgi:hypothetical protein